MSLTLNNIVIESRKSDNFINATQLCKAAGKKFSHWICLDSTKDLIKELEKSLNAGIPAFKKLIDIKKGRYKSGSWIHPDLAVQLAQWLSPVFAIKVSRWIRELFITGNVSIDSKKSDEELLKLQNQVQKLELENKEKKDQIARLERKQLCLETFVRNIKKLEKNQVFYLATTRNYARQNRYEYGGVKDLKELKKRINGYNTGRAEGDLMYICHVVKCNNYHDIEDRINTILNQFKDKPNSRKEMLRLKYSLLLEIVEFIVDNYDREVEYINARCQEFLSQTIEADGYEPPQINLDDLLKNDLQDSMQVTVHRAGKATKTAKIDISDWSDEKIDELFIKLVNQGAREKHENYNFVTDKKLQLVELPWKFLSDNLKIYNGITMTGWREKFKSWFKKEKPKLQVKGIKL